MFIKIIFLTTFFFSEFLLGKNVREPFEEAKYLSRPLDHTQIMSSVDTMTALELDILISRLHHELKKFPDVATEASKRIDLRDLELLLQIVVNKAVTPDYIHELAFLSNEFAKKFYYLPLYQELWVYQIDHAWILAKRQITQDALVRARMDEYLQLTKTKIAHYIYSRGEHVPKIKAFEPVDGTKIKLKGVSISDFQSYKARDGNNILTASDNTVKEGQVQPAIILPDTQAIPEEARPLVLLTEQGSRLTGAVKGCYSLFKTIQKSIYVPSSRSLN